MRIYIFQYLDMPGEPHGGAAVVVAATQGEANWLLEGFRIQPSPVDWEEVIIYPTHNYIEPAVYIFPANAGCC